MSKTLGQLAYEVFCNNAMYPWNDPWDAPTTRRGAWEMAAIAVRDAVLAEHRTEVDRLNAEIARLSAALQRHVWEEKDGVHLLTMFQPVDVAAVRVLPEAIVWETLRPAPRADGCIHAPGGDGLDCAKHLVEVIVGVRS